MFRASHVMVVSVCLQVAQLKTQIESQKLESIKYLAGKTLFVKPVCPVSQAPLSLTPAGGIFSVVTIVLSLMLGLSRLLK